MRRTLLLALGLSLFGACTEDAAPLDAGSSDPDATSADADPGADRDPALDAAGGPDGGAGDTGGPDAATPDGGAGDAAAPSDGGRADATPGVDGGVGADAGASCADLAACCATLADGFLKSRCESTATAGDAMACDRYFGLISQCSPEPDGGTPPPVDAGPAPDAGPPGPVCTDLAMCCPNLSGLAQAGCEFVADRRDEGTCQATYDRLCVAGDAGPAADAGPPGPVCTDLAACCPGLSGIGLQICEFVANSRNEGNCQTAYDRLCVAAPDAGPVPDLGPIDAGPLGPICSEYLACCPSLGPLQGTCEGTAQSADEAQCDQALGLAKRLGQCGGADAGAADI